MPDDPLADRLARLHPQPVYHREDGRSALTHERMTVLERLPPRAKVLEVGAGAGLFSEQLVAAGHDVLALEGDPRTAAECRDRGVSVLVGDADTPELWDRVGEGYDVILFMHLLEHLVDPWHVLTRARDRLAPGGVVISLLPNVAAWRIRRDLFLHGRFEYEDTGILDRTHLRFFTLDSAVELHRQAGFEDVRWTPVETCVPIERRIRVQLHLPAVAAVFRNFVVARLPNLSTEIVLVEAR